MWHKILVEFRQEKHAKLASKIIKTVISRYAATLLVLATRENSKGTTLVKIAILSVLASRILCVSPRNAIKILFSSERISNSKPLAFAKAKMHLSQSNSML